MRQLLLMVGVTVIASVASAKGANWPAPYKAFKGEYAIYSGELGNQQAPTRDDRKLSFEINGQPAKEIFESMAPDDKETCSSVKGARNRTKGNVWCSFEPGDGYRCYFGFDLRTGASIPGGSC